MIKKITLILIALTILVSSFAITGCGTKEVVPGVYYVRLCPAGLGLNDKPNYEQYDSLEDAKAFADENAIYGCIVTDSNYNCIYSPFSEVASEILYQAKIVCDYIRDAGFTYGNAPINPAFNHDAMLVSCDRLVDWVLYRVGFTDQPYENGKCVSGPWLTEWCIEQGFTRISNIEDVREGDIMFVRPDENYNPLHTYICASDPDDSDFSYRYDAGSDRRIQSTQPSYEVNGNFMYAYRATSLPNEKGYIEQEPVELTKFDESVNYTSLYIDDFEDGTKTWKGANQISGLDVRDGFLKFNTTGTDPYIICQNELNLSCDDADCIRIRIKNGTFSDTLQVFLTTDVFSEFTEKLSYKVTLVGTNMDMNDENWEEITIDLTQNKFYTGVITGIRIDPCASKGEVRIDFISIDKIE